LVNQVLNKRDIFNGEIQTVVCWKLDRVSRCLRDGINRLADWCDKGVRVVSVTQQLDFSGATGKLIASVLFAVAEMEQETRRERQAAGIAAAKEEGKYKGRKPGTTKAAPRRAIQLRAKGLSDREIATALGVYFGLSWQAGLVFVATWLIIAIITRISSLSALIATLAIPVFFYTQVGAPWMSAATIIMAILIYWRHRSNIRNILNGNEKSIGQKG
jgi:hypothetical protein